MSERYLVQPSERLGYWVCTDTENLIVCTFGDKRFKDDQAFTTLENFDPENYMLLAKLAREMGDWLRENHYNKLF